MIETNNKKKQHFKLLYIFLILKKKLPLVNKIFLQPAAAAFLIIEPKFPGSRMLPHKMVTGRVGDDKTFNSSALGLLNTPEIK